jgi:hypothetical protein
MTEDPFVPPGYRLPVPTSAIAKLHKIALGRSFTSDAVRAFLFWLVASEDPASDQGRIGPISPNRIEPILGGVSLQRLDAEHRKAVVEVLAWWLEDPSHQPIEEVLKDITSQFFPRKAALKA